MLVLFITGKGNYEEFNKNKFNSNIKVMPYLDNLSALLKSCNLVIGRAGAGTISELLVAKVPSILIPSPNVANNHQYYNAKAMQDKNLAIMIEEKDLDSKVLYERVKGLLSNNEEYCNLKNNLYENIMPSSSEKIYEKIKEVMKNAK